MVRLSQGEGEGEEPPFTIVDGRSDKIRAVDSEIAAHAARWFQTHSCEPKRPSELNRGDGLQLVKKFGVAICMRRPGVRRRSSRFVPNSTTGICGYLIVVKKGEKLPRCGGCGKRVWVKYEDVIFQHDDPRVARMIIQSIKGWQGRGKTIDRLPAAKMGEWARRAEERIGAGLFYKFLPWNLKS